MNVMRQHTAEWEALHELLYKAHRILWSQADKTSVSVQGKNNKTVSGFSQKKQYILFNFYLDDMFRSTDHQKVQAVQISFKQYGIP